MTCRLPLTLLLVFMIVFAGISLPIYSETPPHQWPGTSNAEDALQMGVAGSYTVSGTNRTYALGLIPETAPNAARTMLGAVQVPSHLDWRSSSGYDWMTPVKDQGACGNCVAFSVVGAVEGQYKISHNRPDWSLDLSEQHLFACGGGSCSNGWTFSAALDYMVANGTPDEACSPYTAQSGQAACSASCPDWQSRAYKISSWHWVGGSTSAIETALMSGPVMAAIIVYTDFFTYTSGVYHHTWGDPVGWHGVGIIGYDAPGHYWIVKNSWGTNWGEKGYARIAFGEAAIGYEIAAATVPSPTSVTVNFYTDPTSGTITAGGVTKVSGTSEVYAPGQRVHVVATPPSGYQLLNWETNGVSIDSVSTADTYMTAANNGWLKAHFAKPPPATIKAKSTLGQEMVGIQIIVDGKIFSTPFSLAKGTHKLTAPIIIISGGAVYRFNSWKNSANNTISSQPSLSYAVVSDETLYAVYEPPQFALTMYVKSKDLLKPIAGATVYLDGVLMGTTDTNGKLVTSVYAGSHVLKVTKSGYATYTAKIVVLTNMPYYLYMTH